MAWNSQPIPGARWRWHHFEDRVVDVLRGEGGAELRGKLAHRLRVTKQLPNLLMLLDRYEEFVPLRDALRSAEARVGPDGHNPFRQQPADLLFALGIWTLHHEQDAQPERQLELAEELRAIGKVNMARRLLRTIDRQRCMAFFPRYRRELAMSTCFASDLPPGPRLDEAWNLLHLDPSWPGSLEDIRPGREPDLMRQDYETLRRAGTILKRKWDYERRKEDLEHAVTHYRVAKLLAAKDKDKDVRRDVEISSGAEASFQLDLLTVLDRDHEQAGKRAFTAFKLRRELLEKDPMEGSLGGLEPSRRNYRRLINLAQLHFGIHGQLRRHEDGAVRLEGVRAEDLEEARASNHLEEAKECLRGAKRMHKDTGVIPRWLRDQKVRELAERAEVLRVDPTELQEFLDVSKAHVVNALSAGKVGLALSGGGFRASFFHLGVLARLAERDLLRHVEVVSCVSGGSIVGAHYYLLLRKLLQSKKDEEIGQDDYLELVRTLIHQFLRGVKKNIRMRLLANPLANLRMLFPGYSRADRAGELFERCLYGQVDDEYREGNRLVSHMTIQPPNMEGFNPTLLNWFRDNKVPILILNATSLNTGHNWQFAAHWMGESPASIDAHVDANKRLRRIHQSVAPPPHHEMRLGRAVATSACVPGLFDPSSLKRLYEGPRQKIVVRLVDGGVFDNQGVASLLEQECRIFVVSDASGQMSFLNQPSGGSLGVPLRSNSILMERIRQTQYRDLAVRKRSGQLRSMIFVHLKKELRGDPINWVGCDDPRKPEEERCRSSPMTSYGIDKELQHRLAGYRTDLDSFCDAEAYALMYSGYRMIHGELDKLESDPDRSKEALVRLLDSSVEKPHPWAFLCIKELMEGKKTDPRYASFEEILEVANQRVFKIWRLWGLWGKRRLRGLLGREKRAPRPRSNATLVRALLAMVLIAGLYDLWMAVGGRAGVQNLVASIAALLGPGLGKAMGYLAVSLPVLVVIALVAPTSLFGHVGKFVQMAVLGSVGMVISWLHLTLFDPVYKWYGRRRPDQITREELEYVANVHGVPSSELRDAAAKRSPRLEPVAAELGISRRALYAMCS